MSDNDLKAIKYIVLLAGFVVLCITGAYIAECTTEVPKCNNHAIVCVIAAPTP